MKNKSGIYMILNIHNNKCYVGSTKNFYKRKLEHFRLLILNKHHSNYLQRSYNKYGRDKFIFIVLEECEENYLLEREIFWIDLKKSLQPKYGYNLAIPKRSENLKLREDTLLKLKLNAYKQHKLEDRIPLKDYLAGTRTKHLRVKKGISNKEKIFVFNKLTGNKEYEFESISKTASYFKTSQKRISEVCNGRKKSWVGYIFVKEKDYNSKLEYKITYKKDIPKEHIIRQPRQPFKGNPLKCINVQTNEEIIFNNKFEAIEQLEFTQSGIDKVLYGYRKSHKGYKFELLK